MCESIFIGVVSVLIVASTGYDILCTVKNRECSEHYSKSNQMFIQYLYYYPFHLGQRIPLFLAFSFYTNGKKLLAYKETKSDDTLHCLHGIRVITTQWIVLGHSYLLYALMPIQNLAAIPEVSDEKID